jgi:hypothetical protein
MARRISLLLLVWSLGLLGSPALAGAGGDARPDCCPESEEAPCAERVGPCASLIAMACCDAATGATPAPAMRDLDAPAPLVLDTASLPSAPALRHPRRESLSPAWVPSRSILKRSVVLLI